MNTENELQEATGTRWQPATLIYAVLTGGLILSYLVTQAFDKPNYEYPAFIALLRLIAAAMGIWLGKLWKDKGFWLMIAYLAYKAVRIAVKDPNLFFTSQVSDNLLNGLWVVAGCYALGRVLSTSQLKQFLRMLAALWIAGALIHCGLALYAAWTSRDIPNLSGGSIWGIEWYDRVVVGYFYPTTSGSALNISIMIALCVLLTTPGKPKKAYYFLSLLIFLLTLSLTDSRTSFVSASIGIGVVVGCVVLDLLSHYVRKKNKESKRKKKVITWTISFLCMSIISLFSLYLLSSISPVFIQVRDRGNTLISVAKAEESTQKQGISNRSFTGRESLSGRDEVWENAIGYLSEKPGTLLFGDSVHNPMSGPNSRNSDYMGHCHNMILQIALESGIVGLLFVAFFGAYVANYAIRLLFGEYVQLWKRMIPAMPISVLVGDLAECFGWFRQWNSQALVFLFLAAGIIVSIGNSEKHPSNSSEIEKVKCNLRQQALSIKP